MVQMNGSFGHPYRTSATRGVLVAADVVAIFLAVYVSDILMPSPREAPDVHRVFIFTIGALALCGAYRQSQAVRPAHLVSMSAVGRATLLIGLFVLVTMTTGADGELELPAKVLVYLLVGFPLILLARRVAVEALGRVWPQRIVVVGGGLVFRSTCARLRRTGGIELVDLVPLRQEGTAWCEDLEGLTGTVRARRVDRVIFACDAPSPSIVDRAGELQRLAALTFVPSPLPFLACRSHLEDVHGMPFIHGLPAPMGTVSAAIGRGIELALCVSALVLLAPLLAGIAGAVRATSSGPALFRQVRTGWQGRPFVMLKFRTMREGAEGMRDGMAAMNQADPPLFKVDPDPRVTTIGHMLRRTGLDELPQLVNVVRGDMALVGPRPLPTDEADSLIAMAPRRTTVRPGITGLWQVSGGTTLSTSDLCHLDSTYIASRCVAVDLRIMLITLGRLLRGAGGRGMGSATPRFSNSGTMSPTNVLDPPSCRLNERSVALRRQPPQPEVATVEDRQMAGPVR
jgi:lipopolysaccharide/colanic/teichoic acid biosynthesis glycosyltransferase